MNYKYGINTNIDLLLSDLNNLSVVFDTIYKLEFNTNRVNCESKVDHITLPNNIKSTDTGIYLISPKYKLQLFKSLKEAKINMMINILLKFDELSDKYKSMINKLYRV